MSKQFIVKIISNTIGAREYISKVNQFITKLNIEYCCVYRFKDNDQIDKLLLLFELNTDISAESFYLSEKKLIQAEAPLNFDIIISMAPTPNASSPTASLQYINDKGSERKYSLELINALDLSQYQSLMCHVCGPAGRALYQDNFIEGILCLELHSILQPSSNNNYEFNQLHIANCSVGTTKDDINQNFSEKTKAILLQNKLTDNIFSCLDDMREKKLWAWAKIFTCKI